MFDQQATTNQNWATFSHPNLANGPYGQQGGAQQQQAQPFQMPGGPSLQPGQSFSQSQSGDYFSNPDVVNQLVASLNGGQQSQDYMNFVRDPTSSPYFTNALQGLLAQLGPGQDQQRMEMNDQFRAGGNTSSSTYGQKAAGLETGFDRNRLGTASQLLTTMFPQMTAALSQPMQQTLQLIQALKMNQQTSTQGSSGFAPNAPVDPNDPANRTPVFGGAGGGYTPAYRASK